MSQKPANRPSKRRGRLFLWLAWAVLALVMLLLIGALFLYQYAPILIKSQAQKWYQTQVPNGQLHIGSVQYDLWHGTFALENLRASGQKNTLLAVKNIQLKLDLRALYQRQLDVAYMLADGLYVNISQNQKGDFKIGGIVIPATPKNTTKNHQKTPLPKINLQDLGLTRLHIGKIQLSHSQVDFIQNRQLNRIQIPQINIQNIASHSAKAMDIHSQIQLAKVMPIGEIKINQPLDITLDLKIKNLFTHHQKPSSAEINGQLKNIDIQAPTWAVKTAQLHAQINIDSLNQQPLAVVNMDAKNGQYDFANAPVKISGSFAKLNLKQASARLSTTKNGLLALPFDVLRFDALALTDWQNQLQNDQGQVTIHARRVLLDNPERAVDWLITPLGANLKADLTISAAYHLAEGKTLQTNKPLQIALNSEWILNKDAEQNWQPQLKADAVVENINIAATPLSKQFLKIQKISINDLNTDFKNVNIGQLWLADNVFYQQKNAIFKAAEIELAPLIINPHKINIGSVVLKNSAVDLVLGQNYQPEFVAKLQNYFAVVDQKSAKQNSAAMAVKIQKIHSQNSQIKLVDKNAQNTAHRILMTDFNLQDFDLNNPKTQSRFAIKGNINQYAQLDIHGVYPFFAKHPNGKINGFINNVDLTAYNAYFKKYLGYAATTGALNLKLAVDIQKGNLGGEVALDLLALKVTSDSPAKIAALQQILSMPLDQMLDILRNKQGDIALKLPLKGNLAAPDFALDDVLKLVLQKTLKTAAVLGLKNMFQPYGTLITIGEWAGNQLLAVRLDPIVYEYGEVQLTRAQQQYLDKVSSVLNKKPSLRLKLCPQISPQEADFFALSTAQLQGTAQKRADVVKDYLFKQKNIPLSRLLPCASAVGDSARSSLDLQL